MEGFNVKIKLKSLTCHDKTEKWSKALPYLWTIFFRIDGDSLLIANDFKLVGKGVFKFGEGSHGNLGISRIEKGQTIYIPVKVGEWTTHLTPFHIPYFEQKVPSVIGAITVLMEQNNLSLKGAEAGHKALNRKVQQIINQSLAEFDPRTVDINDVMGSITSYFEAKIATIQDTIEDEIKEAVKNNQSLLRNIWSLVSSDNRIGNHVWNFGQQEIFDKKSIDFDHRWQTGEHGDWEIKGNISIVEGVKPQKATIQEQEAKPIKHTEPFVQPAESISDKERPLEMITSY